MAAFDWIAGLFQSSASSQGTFKNGSASRSSLLNIIALGIGVRLVGEWKNGFPSSLTRIWRHPIAAQPLAPAKLS